MKKILLLSALLCHGLVNNASALPPASPQTQLSWGSFQQDSDGTGTQEVKLQWNEDNNVQGYYLLYVDYHLGFPSDFDQWNRADLGNLTSFSTTLPVGSAYWATIQAYNADGNSSINNIYPVLVKPLVIPTPRIVALISRETEREGLLAGLKQFGREFERVSLDIMMWDTLDTASTKANAALNDPNVIALITTNTSSTLRATQSQQSTQPSLVVAISATSTILKKQSNVLLVPASNDQQVQTMHELLTKTVAKTNRMERYVVVMEESATVAVYSFDLYLSLLKQAFEIETTVPLQGDTEVFGQMLGTFSFNGDPEQATIIADSLTILEPDIVLYLGSAENFSILYAQAPGQTWLGSDSVYDLIPQGFQSDSVKILALGSSEEHIGQGIYYSAYDTIGLLGHILSGIEDQPSRKNVLESAHQLETMPHLGVTGIKGFTETDKTGWYDILVSTSSGWVQFTP